MKKKIILICICILLLMLLIIFLFNNKRNIIVMDGVEIALSLDGNSISSFPTGDYHVNITSSNVVCEYLYDNKESKYKLTFKNIQSGAKCKLEFTSNPNSLKTIVEGAATNEGTVGYRYEAVNSNNYVWFNDELWRIIGSIPTKINSTTTTNYIKIIRNNEIGSLAWHTSTPIPVWTSSSIYTLLNNYYYGKQNGNNTAYCYTKGTTAKAKCDYRQIGISNNANDYYGSMVKNVYWNTGSVTYTDSAANIFSSEQQTQDYQGYVGLINASDYRYGASWLYTLGSDWTISPHASNSNYAVIGYPSNINPPLYYKNVTSGNIVRPVVYLDPTVYVVSGNGTEANPYKLGKTS